MATAANLLELGRIYTVKSKPTEASRMREMVTVNSVGFATAMAVSTAAKRIGCDARELSLQLEKRKGMTHIVVRNHQHWYT